MSREKRSIDPDTGIEYDQYSHLGRPDIEYRGWIDENGNIVLERHLRKPDGANQLCVGLGTGLEIPLMSCIHT